MPRMFIVAVSLALLTCPFPSHALTADDAEAIRKEVVTFLDETPDNNYLVQPEEVFQRISSGKKDTLLVDVRSAKEYKSGHIPGAINIPLFDIAAKESLALLPSDREIIVYCNSGHESSKALTILRLLGFRAFGMKWGMMGWRYVSATSSALKAIADGVSGKYPIEP